MGDIMKMMLTCVSLIFLLFINTSMGFALWQNHDEIMLQNMFHSRGMDVEIIQPISTENDQRLIPYGALKGKGDVDELTYTYNVSLKDDEVIDITKLFLDVRNGVQTFNADEFFNVLINVEYFDSHRDGYQEALITVTIRLEPSNLALVQELSGVRVTLYLDYLCCKA